MAVMPGTASMQVWISMIHKKGRICLVGKGNDTALVKAWRCQKPTSNTYIFNSGLNVSATWCYCFLPSGYVNS